MQAHTHGQGVGHITQKPKKEVNYRLQHLGQKCSRQSWGTISEPWILQPQPKCGFVFVGSHWTLSSYDLEPVLLLQTRGEMAIKQIDANENKPPFQNPIRYLINCLEENTPIEGPLGLEALPRRTKDRRSDD